MESVSLTWDEADRILRAGSPELDELRRFPFGEQLVTLFSDVGNGKDQEGFKPHGISVMQHMNTLLSNEPDKLIKNMERSDKTRFSKAKLRIAELFDSFDESAQMLFRLGALYHDIGKYIIKERHPTIGWYTLEYLNSEDKKNLLSLLGGREDYLQLLMIMIRDHDEFGVLATGEASFPILLRPANSLGDNLRSQQRIISAIMWLNLADMAGTPQLDVNTEDLEKVIDDWEWFLQALVNYSESDDSLDRYVIREAGKENMVLTRICRLILEASRKQPARLAELRKPSDPVKLNNGSKHIKIEETTVYQSVQRQLETVYSTQIPKRNFAREFTHICKLDYANRFFGSLVKYCEGPRAFLKPGDSFRAADDIVDTENLIYAVLAILRRIASTYSAMERIEGEVGSLIGVEMKDLTPGNATEKTRQIIELLIKRHYPGLSWMMSDCLAWYF